MELSPPSLTRSPSTPPSTYYRMSSPGAVEQQYRLQSMYSDAGCGIMDSGSSMVHAGWSSPGSTLPSMSDATGASATPTSMPTSIMPSDYDSFNAYEQQSQNAHAHGEYAQELYHHQPHNVETASTGGHSPVPSHSSFGTPFMHTTPLPPRMKDESHLEAYSNLSGNRYSPPAIHPTSAVPFINDVYGPPQGYVIDPMQQTPHSQSAQHFYIHPSVPHEPVLLAPAAALSESVLADRRFRLRGRRAPRRLTTKEEANFQCEVKGCGKLFSRSYNYKAHMETHDEKREYPFPCEVTDCTKKFVRKTDLQRHHQSVHMKERNHSCDYCGRKFARKDTLRRHMEDGCSKRFDLRSVDLQADAYDALHQQRLPMAVQPMAHPLTSPPPHHISMGPVGGMIAPAMVPCNQVHTWGQ
ncbi:Transcription factor hamlet [Ceratocystis fimbriata CBS 114723]|uniref:Transcription factor hamlet n=1 Tax=Ceratocystis fimbriata CBS 114723 TaxID=1035309 RepID=A0A2C5XFZ3_9PEZI|nr:Transcription factor hamlet [Ceratocystis fimbriata CBS 114723]